MKVIQLFKNETQLIRSAASGNRSAQRHLYERFSGKMLSVCRQYVKDLHHAEEVMLTGFCKVFNHLDNFRNEGSFEGWIRRIMIREAIDYLRSEKLLEIQEDALEKYSDFSDPINAEFDVVHLQEMIDLLPEGYRTVFLMYAVDGYRHAEIASMLNISEGTSKSQLSKARKMLQEQLKSHVKNSGYGTRKV